METENKQNEARPANLAFLLKNSIWSFISIMLAVIGFILWMIAIADQPFLPYFVNVRHVFFWSLVMNPIGIILGYRGQKYNNRFTNFAVLSNTIMVLFYPIYLVLGLFVFI